MAVNDSDNRDVCVFPEFSYLVLAFSIRETYS